MIGKRLFDRQKVIDKYGRYYSYENNIKGVKKLKKIYDKYKDSGKEIFNSYDSQVKNCINRLNYLSFILGIVLSSSYPLLKIDSVEKYEKLINYFENSNSNDVENIKSDKQVKYLFRGQTSVKWNVIPSCLRGIEQTKSYIYCYKNLLNQYNKTEVFDLYKNIINPTPLSYEMTSFFQHAISFSPLIDFTTNIVIATYFALGNNTNINYFFNEDSSLFILDDLNQSEKMKKLEDADLENLKIGIYKTGPKEAVDYQTIFSGMKRIYGTGATTAISYNKTNDRMRYQSGVFVLFSDYIIDDIATNVIYNRNSPGSIVKVIIDKSIKKDLLQHLLAKYPELSIKYLMNPYSRFEEAKPR